MVLVASGGLAWACGGDDDPETGDASTSSGGSGGSGGSSGSGGSGGSSGSGGTNATGGSGGSGPNTTGGSTTGAPSTTGTPTSTTGSGGSAGGAGEGGGAGMAGAGGTAEPTIEELCEADCAKLEQVDCDYLDPSTCVQDFCMFFYNPACDAEFRAYLECDAAADVSDFSCVDGYPSVASECTDLFEATNCEG